MGGDDGNGVADAHVVPNANNYSGNGQASTAYPIRDLGHDAVAQGSSGGTGENPAAISNVRKRIDRRVPLWYGSNLFGHRCFDSCLGQRFRYGIDRYRQVVRY